MNVQRVRMQAVLAVAQGVGIGNSSGQLDPTLLDAIAEDEEEAQAMTGKVNLQRLKAAVLAKYGVNPNG